MDFPFKHINKQILIELNRFKPKNSVKFASDVNFSHIITFFPRLSRCCGDLCFTFTFMCVWLWVCLCVTAPCVCIFPPESALSNVMLIPRHYMNRGSRCTWSRPPPADLHCLLHWLIKTWSEQSEQRARKRGKQSGLMLSRVKPWIVIFLLDWSWIYHKRSWR